MTAHRVRRTAAAAALVLLAPLLAIVLPAPAQALEQSVTVDLTSTQGGRLFRDGTASTCGVQKAYPGWVSGSSLTYATAAFVAPASGCLTVTRSTLSCNQGDILLSAYEGDYHPELQRAHYLGDQGVPSDAQPFGIQVEKGRTYVIVAASILSAACSVRVSFAMADDTTPPETGFVTGPPAKVRDSSIALAFVGTAGDTAGFQCQVDGAAYTACSSPLQLGGLTPGGHTVAVRAVDEAGNVDPTPATAAFLSCDLAGGTLALKSARTRLAGAHRAVAKATRALAKATTPKARKKAKRRVAAATAKRAQARRQVTTLQRSVHSCAS